jgi:hypothetical protein
MDEEKIRQALDALFAELMSKPNSSARAVDACAFTAVSRRCLDSGITIETLVNMLLENWEQWHDEG